jgi:hypothetical protein
MNLMLVRDLERLEGGARDLAELIIEAIDYLTALPGESVPPARGRQRMREIRAELDSIYETAISTWRPAGNTLRYLTLWAKTGRGLDSASRMLFALAEHDLGKARPVGRFAGIVADFRRLAELVKSLLRNSLDCLASCETVLARLSRGHAESVPVLSHRLVEGIHREMRCSPSRIRPGIMFLTAIRELERVAETALEIVTDVERLTGEPATGPVHANESRISASG